MNKKLIASFATGFAVLSLGLVALAEDANTEISDVVPTKIVNMSEEAQKKLEEARERAKEARKVNLEELKKRAELAKERIKAEREKNEALTKEKREKLQEKLSKLKDEQKSKMAEKIAGQFQNLNKRWTDHFMNVLDHYTAILGKIKSRADKAASAGKDVTAVNSAIASAQASIDAARVAVEAQAKKTYVVDPATVPAPTNETTTSTNDEETVKALRKSFNTLKEQLLNELKALRDGKMKDAREAIKNAFSELRKVPGIDEETGTATTTPTEN